MIAAKELRDYDRNGDVIKKLLKLLYERQLVEAWEPRHAALVDELAPGCPPAEKAAAGQLLYKLVENEAQFTLRSVRDRFLTHGSYHILSNRYAVGWHPEYQSDQDDPSDDGDDGMG